MDAETGHAGRGGFVPERGSMEAQVLRVLRACHGAQGVAALPLDPALLPTIRALHALAPRLVFNLTEWVGGDRQLDHAVAALLEALELPYTGTGPEGLKLCRDKQAAKEVVAALGVAVPRTYTRVPGRAAFPLLVKPRYGDGSDGIGNAALAATPAALRRRLAMRRGAPWLCEAFIPGRDIYIGLVGNTPRVLSPIGLDINESDRRRGAPRFATGRVKHDPAYRARWAVRYGPAEVPPRALAEVADISRRIFHALQLRDYARLDFRLTPEGQWVFLEANPNPDLSPHTFGANLCFAGVRYADLITGIAAAARRRGTLARMEAPE